MSRNSFNFLCFIPFTLLFLAGCSPVHAFGGASTPILTSMPALPTLTVFPVGTPGSTPTAVVTVTPTALCSSESGSLEKGIITTVLMDKPMRYSVYLPPCYGFDQRTRYPVLYMLHGQGFTEDQWVRIGATNSADRLISADQVPPFIMVFPFDYSLKQPNQYKFEDVFVKLLLPHIDTEYRTKTDKVQRAIGGLSRGGAWALHIGAKYPELFGAIGGHSPVIFYADENSLRRNLLAMQPNQAPRIWLDAGDSDSEYTLIKSFEEFLNKNNILHEWHGFVGWHDEKYWSAHVDDYLLWYAQAWR
ncbi:MAG: alpha/beta hydrolase-fold protein [Chloroflexota bacterium]